jgi:predicted kinase
MRDCPQDPIYHAEGDVFTHVSLVCRRLCELEEYRALGEDDKQVLAWAAALHDMAKPACTIHEADGRITSPGHAARGAVMARPMLWGLNCPFFLREEICGLIHYHMKVFWALERDDPARLVREISWRCRPRLLALLAQADALGRDCPDTEELLQKVELFRMLAREHECYDGPAEFCTPVARYQYFHERWHDPRSAPYEDFRCQVILLSGLPGSGKDTWIQKEGPPWPVISLDQIRRELKIAPTAPQGKVAEAAREKAREYLRAGQDFIWNATNVSTMIRRKCLSLLLDYKARVRIVYLEQPLLVLEKRNQARKDEVPWKAIEKMTRKWEVPTHLEAHEVLYLADPCC